jgi:entericidin B
LPRRNAHRHSRFPIATVETISGIDTVPNRRGTTAGTADAVVRYTLNGATLLETVENGPSACRFVTVIFVHRLRHSEIKMKMPPSLRHGVARTVLALTLLLGASAMLSACNTTAGVGQDVSATGHAVTNTADKAKEAM